MPNDKLRLKKETKCMEEITRQYIRAKKVLNLVEKLEYMRLTGQYTVTKHKLLNVVSENYEEKEVLEFSNTGYVFMQTEGYVVNQYSAAIFKDGKKIDY